MKRLVLVATSPHPEGGRLFVREWREMPTETEWARDVAREKARVEARREAVMAHEDVPVGR